MRLMWIGIAESIVAGAVGLWLYATLPAADAILGGGVLAFAALSLLASLALGRSGDDDAVEAAAVAGAQVVRAAPVPALPPPAAATPLPPPMVEASDTALLPEPVAHLQREALQSRWAWRAREASLQLATLTEGDSTGREAPRHLRRLTDATILVQGFGGLARGEPPQFLLDAVREGWSRDDVQSRLQQLTQDQDDLRDEAAPWLREGDEFRDPRLEAAAAHHRYDMLNETAGRWEQVAVLTMGYEALLETLDSRRAATGEEGPR
jgi:hypothetical protein